MNPANKILLGLGAVIALILAVIFIWLSIANAHLKTQLAQAQANNTACHLANDEFVTQVARQNKAVETLKTAGVAREKHVQEAAYETQKTVRVYFLAAEKLRRTKMRGDACHAAENIFNAYLGNAK
ncbi:MAG: hypothetical protein WCD70_14160 [Alphaproteobacteria bacterium]